MALQGAQRQAPVSTELRTIRSARLKFIYQSLDLFPATSFFGDAQLRFPISLAHLTKNGGSPLDGVTGTHTLLALSLPI